MEKMLIPPGHFANHRASLKQNEADARAHLRAFWAKSSLGRPVLMPGLNNPPTPPAPPLPTDSLPPEEQDWLADRIRQHTAWWVTHSREQWLGECMPRACMGAACCLGYPAALVGAIYHYAPENGTAWFDPIPNLYDRPLPRFDPQGPRFSQLWECIQAQIDAVQGYMAVHPPVALDGLTTLSLLRDPQQLCLDVLERPEDVRRWSDALTSIYIETYEHAYRMLLRQGHGESGSFFNLTCEGRMEAVQCDFAVMLSPAQFDKFVMPDLRRLTEYLDCSLYHLDGVCQMRFLDQLASLPRLTGIQWNPEPPEDDSIKHLPEFREIRRRNLALLIGAKSVDEAITLIRELGPDGLAIFLPRFQTANEANAAIEKIEKACK